MKHLLTLTLIFGFASCKDYKKFVEKEFGLEVITLNDSNIDHCAQEQLKGIYNQYKELNKTARQTIRERLSPFNTLLLSPSKKTGNRVVHKTLKRLFTLSCTHWERGPTDDSTYDVECDYEIHHTRVLDVQLHTDGEDPRSSVTRSRSGSTIKLNTQYVVAEVHHEYLDFYSVGRYNRAGDVDQARASAEKIRRSSKLERQCGPILKLNEIVESL